MTLYEFLVSTDVDILNNKSPQGNHLSAELARNDIKIDFDKDINDVTEDELLEIGRILILNANKGRFFWSTQLVEMMKEIIDKTKNGL